MRRRGVGRSGQHQRHRFGVPGLAHIGIQSWSRFQFQCQDTAFPGSNLRFLRYDLVVVPQLLSTTLEDFSEVFRPQISIS